MNAFFWFLDLLRIGPPPHVGYAHYFVNSLEYGLLRAGLWPQALARFNAFFVCSRLHGRIHGRPTNKDWPAAVYVKVGSTVIILCPDALNYGL